MSNGFFAVISDLTVSCAMALSRGLLRAPARQNAFCPRCADKPLTAAILQHPRGLLLFV